MRRAYVGLGGRLFLGPEATAKGFVEGALVEIVVLPSTGSVLITLANASAALELEAADGLGEGRRRMLADGIVRG